MINISLAGISVGVDNRYDNVVNIAKDYITDKPAEFSVYASDDQLAEERLASGENYTDGYLESIVVYRNIAKQLPFYDAFVFHGAVIAADGVGYAVTARSGVGKTTHLRLWLERFGSRVHILNGDKPIIRVIDGQVYVCGTPWRGKEGYGVNEILPLGGIAFLGRAEKNSAVEISASEALMDFMSQIYIPRTPDAASRLLALADRVLSAVPLYKLSVNMESDAAQMAYDAFLRK